MTATQRVDVARLSELLTVIASSNPDRRADYPGGCDCHECGCIFIGGDGHDYCAQCEAKRQLLAMLPEALPDLLQQLAELQTKTACTLGVGDGSGQLFVHGDYESIKEAQAIIDKLAERDAEAHLWREAHRAMSELRDGANERMLAEMQRAESAERAREDAHGLLRDVIAWRRTVPIDETPNRKDGGIFGRIAAFLAANGTAMGPTHSAGGE